MCTQAQYWPVLPVALHGSTTTMAPVTLFFMCVVIFRLNITAGPLLAYALFCQTYIFGMQNDLFIYKYFSSHSNMFLTALFKISLVLCSSWILQFLRFTTSKFCISAKLTGIHIQMLNLLTTIYPVLLIIITYILMELHARNYRIIHILWKPFSFLTNKVKITSVTSDAVIHAFATFILLSASTLTFNGMIVFTLSPVHRSIDGTIYKKVLYYDPTIIAYSHEHILYGVLAVVPFILLVLCPVCNLCNYIHSQWVPQCFLCIYTHILITCHLLCEALQVHNCQPLTQLSSHNGRNTLTCYSPLDK